MITLEDIAYKVQNKIRISCEEAVFLFEHPDLITIGRLADEVTQRKNSDTVFYNINRHINPTNICVMDCKFCAFAKKIGEEGAYAYSLEEILQRAEKAYQDGATEIHMVGGLHPRWTLATYEGFLQAIKEKFPSLHIKGFTAVEIDWLARKTRISHEDTIKRLRAAGLDSLPGGGAEVFHEDIREQITAKLSTEKWVDIHRTAHRLGMHSNCTLLYGHVETYEHRVYHLDVLRKLQDETGGFNCFIPLSFQPHQNEMGIDRYTFGFDDLKMMAVARIFLDNFTHIKSYWTMLGQEIAQLALSFGSNDLDGTVVEEKISRMAGGRSGESMSRAVLEGLIKKTNKRPIERDTLYNCVKQPEAASTRKDPTFLLHKLTYGEKLSASDLATIAEGASLHTLSGIALKAKDQWHSRNTIGFTYKIHEPSHLHGFIKLWHAAREQGQELSAYCKTLFESGTQLVVGSFNESENHLTEREIFKLHEACHVNEIPTIAKLELDVQHNGAASWEKFFTRISTFRELHAKTQGLLGVALMPGKDSFVSIHEYLVALAMLRSVFSEVCHIIAPFAHLPIHSKVKGLGARFQKAEEKIAPLTSFFGADHIGFLEESWNITDRLAGDFKAAHLSLQPIAFR